MPYSVRLKEDVAADGDHGAAGGVGRAIDSRDFGTMRLTLDVTKAEGEEPTLDVAIDTAEQASGPWAELGTLTQATAIGSERVVVVGCDRFVRARWEIGGTSPAFRFSILGEGV